MATELRWVAPGEGDWWLVREHFPNAVCRMFSALFPPATRGWTVGAASYGLPTGEPRWGAVNGWIYYGPQIPPTADELAAREAAAATTLAAGPGAGPWRAEAARWHEDERPRAVAAMRGVQSVDPAVLDDRELADHVRLAADTFLRWAPLHFEHTGFDIAAGLLLSAATGWGVEPAELVGLLAGASPASAAVDAGLRRIADALDRAGVAQPVGSLDDIRAAGAEAAEALDAHLDEYGWRPVSGQHLLEPTLVERPELLVAAVEACRRRPRATPRPDAAADVRAAVPGPDRARFDELLADARTSYALRDDDVGVCWNWPLGLLRRAALEAGRRLATRGLLADPDHLFEAEVDEVAALLVGTGDGPSAGDLVARWELRERAGQVDPPRHLAGGGDPATVGELPPAVARLAAIRDAVWSVVPPRVDAPLHGVGIGSRPAVGPARIVRHPEELVRLVEGDVLVAVTTTTAYNAVFPLLSAVVTEQGGLLSHTAILARELDLPAVVGVADVLAAVHDGDLVEVDPAVGAVRVVDRAG
jgi:pyruvate,water dikinase